MKVKISFLTDLHFGNPKIQLNRLIASLHEYAYPIISESQLLLLGGDFFDCLLNMNSDAGIMAIYIIDELIQLAIDKHIYVRVLRGTFSHDRYQNRLFVERARSIPAYNDLPLIRTIDKIEIERFPVFGLDILFCPDDQPQKDVSDAILEVLRANHLDKVDYMCCHGYWEHLLSDSSMIKPHNCLDYSRLNDKVRYQVFNGHVHSPGIYNNKIISGGSFERFRHGEEEDKGFYIVDYDTELKTSAIHFVRNKKAVPFITLRIDDYTTAESALAFLDTRVTQDLKHYDTTDEIMHIRICGDGTAIAPIIKAKYPKAVITEKHDKTNRQTDVAFINSISDLPLITIENLPELIYSNIKEQHPEITIDRIKEILNDNGV